MPAILEETSQVIQWGNCTMRTAIDNMRVNHRCLDVRVTKQLLNGADVGAGLQKVRCERMPKCVASDVLIDACFLPRRCNGHAYITAVHSQAKTVIQLMGINLPKHFRFEIELRPNR